MLPKALRVKRSEFKLLDRPYKSVSSKFFSVRIYKTDSLVSKFAFSISKKIEKKAVLRNKIRRTAYKTVQDRLSIIKSGFLFHFFLNKKPSDIKNDITKDISILLDDFIS